MPQHESEASNVGGYELGGGDVAGRSYQLGKIALISR